MRADEFNETDGAGFRNEAALAHMQEDVLSVVPQPRRRTSPPPPGKGEDSPGNTRSLLGPASARGALFADELDDERENRGSGSFGLSHSKCAGHAPRRREVSCEP